MHPAVGCQNVPRFHFLLWHCQPFLACVQTSFLFLTQLRCCQLSQQLLIGVPFSGRHHSFVPLAGNGNFAFHGDSSVSHDFLGNNATLACQRKCLVCHAVSSSGLCGFSLFLYTVSTFWSRGTLMLRSPPWTGFWLLIASLSTLHKGLRRCRMFQFLYISGYIIVHNFRTFSFRYVPSFKIPTKYKIGHVWLLYCL